MLGAQKKTPPKWRGLEEGGLERRLSVGFVSVSIHVYGAPARSV
jgi:hypothetical protein